MNDGLVIHAPLLGMALAIPFFFYTGRIYKRFFA
jgi:hypothetical protein